MFFTTQAVGIQTLKYIQRRVINKTKLKESKVCVITLTLWKTVSLLNNRILKHCIVEMSTVIPAYFHCHDIILFTTLYLGSPNIYDRCVENSKLKCDFKCLQDTWRTVLLLLELMKEIAGGAEQI